MSFTEPFSFDTIQEFDDHIAKSVPNYLYLADMIRRVAPFFVREKTAIVDLGCSTGSLLESIDFKGAKHGYDISENLLPKSHGKTKYHLEDIVELKSLPKSSLVLSIFTLQFVDLGSRAKIIQNVYDSLVSGGAFIWAEKVTHRNGFWQNVFNSAYYDFKEKSFTAEEILAKEKDLRYIMTPNTQADNIAIATGVGFESIAIFWKFYNFECYIMVKK